MVSMHLTGGPLDGQVIVRDVDTVPPTTVPTYSYGIDCGDFVKPAPRTAGYVPTLDALGHHKRTAGGAWMFTYSG